MTSFACSLSMPVVLNRCAVTKLGAVKECQGCREVSLSLIFVSILASKGTAKYLYIWPCVPRAKKGWETLLNAHVCWCVRESECVWVRVCEWVKCVSRRVTCFSIWEVVENGTLSKKKKKGGATLSLPGWIYFTEVSRFVTTTIAWKHNFVTVIPCANNRSLKLQLLSIHWNTRTSCVTSKISILKHQFNLHTY